MLMGCSKESDAKYMPNQTPRVKCPSCHPIHMHQQPWVIFSDSPNAERVHAFIFTQMSVIHLSPVFCGQKFQKFPFISFPQLKLRVLTIISVKIKEKLHKCIKLFLLLKVIILVAEQNSSNFISFVIAQYLLIIMIITRNKCKANILFDLTWI